MLKSKDYKKHMPVKQKYKSARHPKSFLKVYAPYLPLLAILGFGLLISFGDSFKQTNSQVLGYANGINTNNLLQETNSERTSNSLSRLKENPELTKAAQAKATDMAKRNYWSHQTPEGKQPWAFANDQGYKYTKIAENLAYGFNSSNSTLAGWMNSPEHKANILDPSLADVGFGVANSANYQNHGPETIVVALYGKPAEGLPTTPATKKDIPNNKAKISYIQTITNGRAPWSGFVAGLLIGGIVVYLIATHAKNLRKSLRISEKFIIKHPLLDLTLIALVALIAILSQTAGFVN